MAEPEQMELERFSSVTQLTQVQDEVLLSFSALLEDALKIFKTVEGPEWMATWIKVLSSKVTLSEARKALENRKASTAVSGNGYPLCKLLPEAGEIIADVEAEREMRRVQKPFEDYKRPIQCQKCGDSGWEPVVTKPNTVRRCYCKRQQASEVQK